MSRGLKKFRLQRNIDDLVGPILSYFLLSIKRRRKIPEKIRKVCVIKLSGIGDAILTLPLLKKLKEKGKKVLVIAGNENACVYQNQPFIEELITFDIKKINPIRIMRFIRKMKAKKIDVVIGTSQTAHFSAIVSCLIGKFCIGFSNPKTPARNKLYDMLIMLNPKRHMIFAFLDLAAPLNINFKPEKISLIKLPFSSKEARKINRIVKKSEKLVGLHPCSVFDYREWPKERWVKIIEYLIKKYKFKVLILGSKDETYI